VNEAGERHASWLELFFDLVVLVAVARLAHRLQHPTWANGLGVVALLLLVALWRVACRPRGGAVEAASPA
ncbi:low temperature requirement protein A, partial [Nonomuraea sp. RK-328]|nr:low temperature requirement protein A [Nonomuraea sp. RK-328]